MRRALATLALAALVLGAPPSTHAGSIDAKIQAQQAKLHDVRAALAEKRAQLDAARGRVGSIAAQVAATNSDIAAVQGRLAELAARVRSTKTKLAWNRVQLVAAQATLQRHSEALKRRLIDAYEYGDIGYLAVMLEAKSFGDFVDRWNDIRYVIVANQATIRQRRVDAAKVAAFEAKLVGDEAVLQSAATQAEQQQRALDALASQKQALLGQAESEKDHVATQVHELDDISAQSEAALEGLVAEKQREEEARRAAARRAAMLNGDALPPETGAPGALAWPVSGTITSPFGMRMHPVYGRAIFHAGIDIAAPSGTTVSAAGDGRVIIAGYNGDCGNMITIDHRGGLSTTYCHMSQLFVGKDQDVQRGQAIGAVGMTGDATGPHLHFQVMQDAKPIDPMHYLR